MRGALSDDLEANAWAESVAFNQTHGPSTVGMAARPACSSAVAQTINCLAKVLQSTTLLFGDVRCCKPC